MPAAKKPKVIQLAVHPGGQNGRILALDDEGKIWSTEGRNLASPKWSEVPGPN